MPITHFQAVLGGIVLVGGATTVVAASVRKALRTLKPIGDFLDDWRGTPARPGHQAVPGVMQWLANLDDGQLHIIDRLARVEAQQTPNGGSSMRDEIQQIKRAVAPPSPGRHRRVDA